MTNELDLYRLQLEDILQGSITLLSDIKPSDWTEGNLIMPKPFPGPFRYDRTPYTREIIDCLAPDHPARWVAVMKGAQVGFSSGVIYPGVGWLIKNAPGNAFITVGAPDLIEKAMEKLDLMIDNAGLRGYIKPSVQRNRAQKSGDTNYKKEFSGGYVTIASANNHKAIRQIDLQYGFFDDFESIKAASKESGSTRKLLEQRFAAYADTHKIFYISTPELKAGSNIEPAYLLGDQRKYLVPCPCCAEMIELEWAVEGQGLTAGQMCGITWEADEYNKLIRDSVGYICQKCGGFFDDRNKGELLINGMWEPTAAPSQPGYYSYHLSSLYAPIGMYDWEHYVSDWLEAHPVGQPRKEDLYKTFVNVCLGETYEGTSEAPKANAIQKNQRPYEIGLIPEKLSLEHGNGKIVLVTCAADMNGVEDDARLDYEIIAWAESGATYSIQHGSIGTFIPRENNLVHKKDRDKWTYALDKPNSVWPVFDAILAQQFKTDTTREIPVLITALDCGYYATNYAYPYLERTNNTVLGVKGDKEDQYIRHGLDVPNFKASRERPEDLFILQVGLLKDDLSDYMQLKWDERDARQPVNFMNFPLAGRYVCPIKKAYYDTFGLEYKGDELYGYTNFFQHYEAEHRVTESAADGTGVTFRWVKKTATAQNHMFDCRIYNLAIRDIFIAKLGKELEKKNFTWRDFVALVAPKPQ